MAYTTETKVENMFGLTITGAGSTALAVIISAVQAYIDRYCGKSFEAASATRYYDLKQGEKDVLIDAFVGSPTEVKVLDSTGDTISTLTEGQANDYIIAPYNNTEKNRLILTGNGSWFTFPAGVHRLKVTASFGASTTVPADIELAATQLAGNIYNDNLSAGDGALTSIRLGDYAATYSSDISTKASVLGVNEILDAYRDIDI